MREREREGVREREKDRQLSGRHTDTPRRHALRATDLILMCGGNKIFSKLQQKGVTAEMAFYKNEKGRRRAEKRDNSA